MPLPTQDSEQSLSKRWFRKKAIQEKELLCWTLQGSRMNIYRLPLYLRQLILYVECNNPADITFEFLSERKKIYCSRIDEDVHKKCKYVELSSSVSFKRSSIYQKVKPHVKKFHFKNSNLKEKFFILNTSNFDGLLRIFVAKKTQKNQKQILR